MHGVPWQPIIIINPYQKGCFLLSFDHHEKIDVNIDYDFHYQNEAMRKADLKKMQWKNKHFNSGVYANCYRITRKISIKKFLLFNKE